MSAIAPPPIDSLPESPSTDDPDNFDDEGDQFLGALQPWGVQLTALGQNAYLNAAIAAERAGAAEDSADDAANAAALAQAAASGAVNAADLTATSTTSLAVGTGIKTLILQAGKAFKQNMPARLASSATLGVFMDGYFRSYDPVTGATSFLCQRKEGSGTLAAWTMMLAGAVVAEAYVGGGGAEEFVGLAGGTFVGATSNKLQIASAGSNAVFQLDDPGTVPTGYNLFELVNRPDDTYNCDITIADIDNNHLGYLPPGRATAVHLSNAYGWVLPDASPVGKPLRFSAVASARIAGTAGTFVQMVELDANRKLFLVHGVSLHGVVYDAAINEWGALTLIRAAWGGAGAVDNVRSLLIDADTVLVASCPENSTAMFMRVLSISGTTINPGAAQTSGLTVAAARLIDLFVVGTSYVLLYTTSAGVARMQARTVSAGVVSAPGTEVASGANTVTPIALPGPSTTFAIVTAASTTLTATPYTVSGTSIGAGGAQTQTISALTSIYARYSRLRWVISFIASSGARVAVVSFSGTSITLTVTPAWTSAITTTASIQMQHYNYSVMLAVTGTDVNGGFLTEFTSVFDSGSGQLSATVGVAEYSLAAQTVAPLGTNDTDAAPANISQWMISTAKGIEYHSFVDAGVFVSKYRKVRLGPMSYAVGLGALATAPKQSLHNSVLHKPGTLTFATLGDGSKPGLFSTTGNDMSALRATPQLIGDPVNGAKSVNDSSVWLAHSMGPDAVLTLEQVRIA